MAKVILTIDDIPQKVTIPMVDYLLDNCIHPVMFMVGENADKNRDILDYVIKSGITVGNHSYSHPFFSNLSFDKAVREIEKTEDILSDAYARTGMKRQAKLFRFPYIDKGGSIKADMQNYLKNEGFVRMDDSDVQSPGYLSAGWDKDYDITCSFDCQEYNIPSGTMTIDDVMKRLDEGDKGMGSDIVHDDCTHIMLLHSHDDTEALVHDYYKLMIEHMLRNGIQFIDASFV